MLDTSLVPASILYTLPGAVVCNDNYLSNAPIYYVNADDAKRWLRSKGHDIQWVDITSHAHSSIRVDPQFISRMRSPFDDIMEELRKADLAVGNLECTLSLRGRRTKNDACYRADPSFASHLARAGFGILSLGNNHSMDFGEVALSDTVACLRESGVDVIGVSNIELQGRSCIKSVADLQVGFLGYNAVGPITSYAAAGECGTVPFNMMEVERDIEEIRDRVNSIVISVHWGREQVLLPTLQQVEMAKACIEAGADLVIGHHSHLPGNIERYQHGLIVYSLGNCIFGHGHTYWSNNYMIRVTMGEEGWRHGELIAIDTMGDRVFGPARLEQHAAVELYARIQRASPTIEMEISELCTAQFFRN